MYLSDLAITNFRMFGDGDSALRITFDDRITALVGRNDSGKSAIIDAIRYALLTRDQEFIRHFSVWASRTTSDGELWSYTINPASSPTRITTPTHTCFRNMSNA